MKKVLLSLSLVFTMGAYAQEAALENNTSFETLTPAQKTTLEQTLQSKSVKRSQKVQGGPVSQRMSHSDIVSESFGGYGNGVLETYVQVLFQDSTVVYDFGTPTNANVFAAAQTFDLTQPQFMNVLGQTPFAEVDAYVVDSLWIGGFYEVNLPATTGQYTGDTLVIEIVSAPESDPDAWGGLYYPAGTFTGQTNDIDLLPLAYLGANAHGYQGGLTDPNKVVVKYALTMDDTLFDPANGGNGGYIAVDIPNINASAGDKIGVSVTFKAGYSYNAGDVLFASSSASSTAVLNSFRALLGAAASSTDDTPYFLEELSLNSPSYGLSQLLFANTRYNQWTGSSAFRNEVLSPNPTLGWLMDIKVTGTSTFSVNENGVASFDIYPNPTAGNVTLNIAQGGTYNINVMNMVGQVVYSETVTVNSGEKLSRDFSSFDKGIYLVNLDGENGSKTSKLTIK